MTERHATHRELADHADGLLRGARLERVEAHLGAGCTACGAGLARHATLVAAIGAGPLPAPPARVARRAQRLFAAARVQRAAHRVREVLATLVFDQRMAPSPALRGTGASARRLLWSVDGLEIVISLAPREGRVDLLGEVLPAQEGDDLPRTVRIAASDGPVHETQLDDEDAFEVRGLTPGAYVLTAAGGGLSLRTPPFLIG